MLSPYRTGRYSDAILQRFFHYAKLFNIFLDCLRCFVRIHDEAMVLSTKMARHLLICQIEIKNVYKDGVWPIPSCPYPTIHRSFKTQIL